MGEGQNEGAQQSSKNVKGYKTEPLEKSNSQINQGQHPDPYVIRAMNRAKVKIRDKMFHLNGGQVH